MQRPDVFTVSRKIPTTHMTTKGFTLIELLVVIAIIAILSVVVVLALNPAELLRQARDSNRISDLSSLKTGLQFYATDVSGNALFGLGNGTFCYVDLTSVAAPFSATGCDPDGVGALPTRFLGGTTTASPAAQRGTDGTGWIPVNFTLISSGSPLSALPLDPAPSAVSGLFYAYRPGTSAGAACTAGSGVTGTGSTCTTFEINAHMESVKYRSGGAKDVEMTDGGNSNAPSPNGLYEVGTAPGLAM